MALKLEKIISVRDKFYLLYNIIDAKKQYRIKCLKNLQNFSFLKINSIYLILDDPDFFDFGYF